MYAYLCMHSMIYKLTFAYTFYAEINLDFFIKCISKTYIEKRLLKALIETKMKVIKI